MDCVLETDKYKRILHMYGGSIIPHSLEKRVSEPLRKHVTSHLSLLGESAPSQIFLFHIQVEAFLCIVPFLYCNPGGPCKGLIVFHNMGLCYKDLWDQDVLGEINS